jgi:hypothetical protein
VTLSKVLVVALGCVLALAGCGTAAGPQSHAASVPPPARTAVIATTVPPRDELVSLQGNTRNAIAWAPLSDADDISVEGSVPSSRAWSTSKVLVIAAYLDTNVDGDPSEIPDEAREWIRAALTESDGPSIAAIRNQIDEPGEAMTRILRAIGDTATTAPDSHEGSMQWSVAEQVRFMAALGNGRVVSPQSSAFLLQQMQPISSQRWGLADIGASAFKPGWVSSQTETRQMGIVGNHAVAIITAGDGPATRQSDGDYAHEWQLNRLAQLLLRRIGQDPTP